MEGKRAATRSLIDTATKETYKLVGSDEVELGKIWGRGRGKVPHEACLCSLL